MVEMTLDYESRNDPIDVDQAAVCLVLDSISRGDWVETTKLLGSKKSRRRLQTMFSVFLATAHAKGSLGKLLEVLPKRLSPVEGCFAFDFVYDIKSENVARDMLERRARPSVKTFTALCDDYVSREDTVFEYQVIKQCVQDSKYNWRAHLQFAENADYYDVMLRAQASCKPSYSMICFAIMPAKAKRKIISQMQTVEQFHFLLKHDTISEQMMNNLSFEVKSEVLREKLGL